MEAARLDHTIGGLEILVDALVAIWAGLLTTLACVLALLALSYVALAWSTFPQGVLPSTFVETIAAFLRGGEPRIGVAMLVHVALFSSFFVFLSRRGAGGLWFLVAVVMAAAPLWAMIPLHTKMTLANRLVATAALTLVVPIGSVLVLLVCIVPLGINLEPVQNTGERRTNAPARRESD